MQSELDTMFFLLLRTSSQLNGMPNPLAHSWLKPNVQHLSSGNSGGPINLLTNNRSSQEIPEIITGNKLSTNEAEKKLKANMAIVQASCISKSVQNSKVQNNMVPGESQPAPRRQVGLHKFVAHRTVEPHNLRHQDVTLHSNC